MFRRILFPFKICVGWVDGGIASPTEKAGLVSWLESLCTGAEGCLERNSLSLLYPLRIKSKLLPRAPGSVGFSTCLHSPSPHPPPTLINPLQPHQACFCLWVLAPTAPATWKALPRASLTAPSHHSGISSSVPSSGVPTGNPTSHNLTSKLIYSLHSISIF